MGVCGYHRDTIGIAGSKVRVHEDKDVGKSS